MWLPCSGIHWESPFWYGLCTVHLKPVILLFLPQIAISSMSPLDRLCWVLSPLQRMGIYDQNLNWSIFWLTLTSLKRHASAWRVFGLDHKAVNKYAPNVLWSIIWLSSQSLRVCWSSTMTLFNSSCEDFQDAAMPSLSWSSVCSSSEGPISWGIQIFIPHDTSKNLCCQLRFLLSSVSGWMCLSLPHFGFIGAAIVSVLTESLQGLIQLYYTRHYLKEVPIIGLWQNYFCICCDVWSLCYL